MTFSGKQKKPAATTSRPVQYSLVDDSVKIQIIYALSFTEGRTVQEIMTYLQQKRVRISESVLTSELERMEGKRVASQPDGSWRRKQ